MPSIASTDEAKTLYEWAVIHLERAHVGDRDTAESKLNAGLEIFQKIGAKKDVEKVLARKEG